MRDIKKLWNLPDLLPEPELNKGTYVPMDELVCQPQNLGFNGRPVNPVTQYMNSMVGSNRSAALQLELEKRLGKQNTTYEVPDDATLKGVFDDVVPSYVNSPNEYSAWKQKLVEKAAYMRERKAQKEMRAKEAQLRKEEFLMRKQELKNKHLKNTIDEVTK